MTQLTQAQQDIADAAVFVIITAIGECAGSA